MYLVASAVLPYLVCCLGGVQFQWSGLARLVALALTLGLWFRLLKPQVRPPAPGPRSHTTPTPTPTPTPNPQLPTPDCQPPAPGPRSPAPGPQPTHNPNPQPPTPNPRIWADLAFLALIPFVLLGGYLTAIYVPVNPKLKDIVFLGHISLDQMAVMVLLVERRVPDAGYGFLPNLREWRIGVLHFLYFAPVGLALALLLHLVAFTRPAAPWLIVPAFFGFLWTVALSEEFFIWGVLQKWLAEWTASPTAAMIGASLTFGLMHIGFRVFPNGRWVLLAGTMGWFCGRARNRAGSIRAGMVTHALVFAVWKAFFA